MPVLSTDLPVSGSLEPLGLGQDIVDELREGGDGPGLRPQARPLQDTVLHVPVLQQVRLLSRVRNLSTLSQ
jgi:hypothetical protein